jgi:quercetin dioxygenase-like cupin family protein
MSRFLLILAAVPLLILAAVLLLILPAAPLMAADQVEIDNAWVHVLRVKMAAHERSAPRDHPPSVSVFLTGIHEKVTGADGGSRDFSAQAGDVAYSEAERAGEENLSGQTLEKIVVELKRGAPPSSPVALDPVKLDPEHHLVPIENDRVRVLRTILEPHLKSPMHEHPHYVVVYLTELHTNMTLGDGRTVDNPRRPGEVAWRDYMKHETENLGDKTAVEIQIELKR